jgi:hypothetical protein
VNGGSLWSIKIFTFLTVEDDSGYFLKKILYTNSYLELAQALLQTREQHMLDDLYENCADDETDYSDVFASYMKLKKCKSEEYAKKAVQGFYFGEFGVDIQAETREGKDGLTELVKDNVDVEFTQKLMEAYGTEDFDRLVFSYNENAMSKAN